MFGSRVVLVMPYMQLLVFNFPWYSVSEFMLMKLCGLWYGHRTEKLIFITYLQQEVILQTNNLQTMCNLQLLWLVGALIEGDFAQMPLEIKWLRWEKFPLKFLPCEWNMKHLAEQFFTKMR